MKKLIAKALLAIIVVAGVASNVAANPKLRMFDKKFEDTQQSLRDTSVFNKKYFRFKGILVYLVAGLLPPWDIEGPGGGKSIKILKPTDRRY